MSLIVNYTMSMGLTGIQRALFLTVLVLFTLYFVKEVLSFTLSRGGVGAGVLSSTVAFLAVLLVASIAVQHIFAGFAGIGALNPFRAVDGVLTELTGTLGAF